MFDESRPGSPVEPAEPDDLYNEVEWPITIAVLKADADAALDAGHPVTADAIRNQARELEGRRHRLHKAILAARGQFPF